MERQQYFNNLQRKLLTRAMWGWTALLSEIETLDIPSQFDILESWIVSQETFFNSQPGLKMVNLWVIFVISVGISQTGKVIPKPILGLIKPNLTPRMG